MKLFVTETQYVLLLLHSYFVSQKFFIYRPWNCVLGIFVLVLKQHTIIFLWTFLTFESLLYSVPTGLTSSVRVWSQLPSLARRRKVSPTKQSSALGSNFLLAKGSGWQHQSSTMAFQLPLGSGRTRLNTLKKRNKMQLQVFIPPLPSDDCKCY